MFTKDLIERVLRTFIQAFAGVWATASLTDLSVPALKALCAAGVAAGLTAAMAVLARPLGSSQDNGSAL